MKKIIVCFLLVLALLMTFFSCDDKPSDSDEKGILTVKNAPSVVDARVFENITPTSRHQIIQMILNQDFIAHGVAPNNDKQFRLSSLAVFSKSGNFLVTLDTVYSADGGRRYKTGVKFNNGCATIDWNTMTPVSDLPEN